jgi:hypothetical protein
MESHRRVSECSGTALRVAGPQSQPVEKLAGTVSEVAEHVVDDQLRGTSMS